VGGRTQQFGEDPYLISTYGRAAVEGYMGKTFSSVRHLTSPQRSRRD
jgi:beta-glucosidase-like glycosyl hydrolase